MDEKLVEYIKKHVEHGTNIDELKQSLLNAGHDISIVEQHINYVVRHRKIKDYIKRHVKIGSDIDKLKQYLVRAGYDINIVEEHINDALKAEKKRKKILIGFALAVILILISATGFYSFEFMNKKLSLPINESREAEIKYKQNIEIFNQALISNDSNVCDKIVDNKLKEDCQRKFSTNISNETINDTDESAASKELLNKALITRNASICAEIQNTAIQVQCNQILVG